MRSKILPTLYSIVHGPKNKRKTKPLTKETKTAIYMQNKTKNKHFKFEDTYTHMPKRAYYHKFTKPSYVHTNITKMRIEY